MPNHSQVFLAGSDGTGWSLDEDIRLIRRSMNSFVEFTDLKTCNVIQSTWWRVLLSIPNSELIGKRLICHCSGEPNEHFKEPLHPYAVSMIGSWITRSTQAFKQLSNVGIKSVLVPYLIDQTLFNPLSKNDERLASLRSKWKIPKDKYVITSFQRDTSGSDVKRPKLVKGPDIFLEIVDMLHKNTHAIHILLAGPRRTWLISNLLDRKIPFTYVGNISEHNDKNNILPRSTLNLLYNIADLYLVASRSEGGPHAVLEAASAKCKIISTPVGLARDVLQDKCIYNDPVEAVKIIEADIASNTLKTTVDMHYRCVQSNHSVESAKRILSDIYSQIDEIPVYDGKRNNSPKISIRVHPFGVENQVKLSTVGFLHNNVNVSLGIDQGFQILKEQLINKNINVLENRISKKIEACLLFSTYTDIKGLKKIERNSTSIVHKINGSMWSAGRSSRHKIDQCFGINSEFATATILESVWMYTQVCKLGYTPVNPVVIPNIVNSHIFHKRGRITFSRHRKIRLISINMEPILSRDDVLFYKWIDKNLDWGRFEFMLIGNTLQAFGEISCISPVSPRKLSEALRQHDIFVSVKKEDPCSIELLEALNCRLPVLYVNSGGNAELVSCAGLPYSNKEEFISNLETLTENYLTYQNLINIPTIEEIGKKTLTVLDESGQMSL